jgi:LysM repeat protein
MTNVLRSRFARPLVLAAAALIALGACGGDDDGAGGEESGGTTTLASVFPTIPPVGTTAPAGGVTLAPVATNPDGTPIAPTTVAPGSGQTSPPPPSTTTTIAGQTPEGVAGFYTVKAGDCLACIAQDLGVDFNALLEVNGFTADSLITPGQKIKVPSGGTATGDSSGSASSTTAASSSGSPAVAGQYTVVAGDCWTCIAKKLGVDYDDLLSVNGANADTLLVPGQKIKVPTGDSSTTVAATTTTVR